MRIAHITKNVHNMHDCRTSKGLVLKDSALWQTIFSSLGTSYILRYISVHNVLYLCVLYSVDINLKSTLYCLGSYLIYNLEMQVNFDYGTIEFPRNSFRKVSYLIRWAKCAHNFSIRHNQQKSFLGVSLNYNLEEHYFEQLKTFT